MTVFIAGICGTFMAGIAQLAKARGHRVRGCDANVYPPMSDLLRAQHIDIAPGYLPEHLDDLGARDTVIIGNALSRGNPLVEQVLNRELAFCSGPEWLREQVLAGRKVIAVAGTHGKTSASAMLAWILECNRLSPGYLIGGKPGNFDQSASLGGDGGGVVGGGGGGGGGGGYFVIEADEYDTAFFDKRAKFVHYRPHIAVLNNLEFDHADIYDDISQIVKQFHHLVRIVPGRGSIVVNADDARLAEVIGMGCWSNLVRFSVDDTATATECEWRAVPLNAECSRFEVLHHGQTAARVDWRCIGRHNMQNALAALAAADLAGVPAARAGENLRDYVPAERRLQRLFESDAVSLYDDFAHHPSAIHQTLDALRARHPQSRLIAVVELRSNTMKSGAHGTRLARALERADCAIVSHCANAGVALPGMQPSRAGNEILQLERADEIISAIKLRLGGNAVIITMSNGDFGGLPRQIAEFLTAPA